VREPRSLALPTTLNTTDPPPDASHAAWGLRTRFALYVGAAGLLLGLLATIAITNRSESQALENKRLELDVAASRLAEQLASDLQARRRELALTAGLIRLTQQPEPDGIREVLETLQAEQPNYAWIGLIDATGRVVAATGRLLEGRDASGRPWFRGAWQGHYLAIEPHDAPLLTSLLPESDDGEPIRLIDLAYPLNGANDGPTEVLSAHLHWRWAQRTTTRVHGELRLVPSVEFFIASQDGRLLHGPAGDASVSAGLRVADLLADSRYLAVATFPASDERQAGLGWSVVARQSMTEVMAPVERTRQLMLFLAAALGAAFLAVTWWVSSRVAAPLAQLTDEARAFHPDADRRFDTPLADRTDEVGLLARTLRGVVERLRIQVDRNRLFIEHAPVPLAVFDKDMRYLNASRRWITDYGLEGHELIGCSHYDIFPEVPKRWRDLHARGLAGEVVRAERDLFVRTDGRQHWVRREIHPWRLPGGDIGGIAIFSEDITARVQGEEALQASEAQFRSTFEQAAVGIAHIAMDGRLLRVNERLCQLVGYSREELLATDLQALTHPQDLQLDVQQVDDLRAGRITHYQLDKRYLRKDGSPIWVALTSALVHTADGTPDYLMSVVKDVSDRKRAETALRLSEQRLRLATEAAGIGIFDWDVHRQTILWTPELESLYGLEPSPGGGLHGFEDWQRTVHPDDLPAAIERFQAALLSYEPTELEWRIVPPGQPVRWVSARFQAFAGESGQPSHLLGVNLDITRQKAMEAELRQNAVSLAGLNARLSGLIEAAMDAVISIDERHRIVLVNGSAEKMFGHPAAALMGQSLEMLIPAELRPGHGQRIDNFRRTGVTSRRMGHLAQVSGLRADGTSFPAEASISQFKLGAETIFTVILRDITERVASEQARAKLEAQLQQAQKMEALGTLAGGIAHDFNNILTAIGGHLELARLDVEEGPLRQHLTDAARAAQRATELVRQILTFSRRQPLERTRVELQKLVPEALNMLRATLPASIELLTRIDATAPKVLADRSQLHQALMNLVVNAAQAIGKRPGRIEVTLGAVAAPCGTDGKGSVPEPWMRLSVADDGPGMDAATVQRIFDPFFTTKPVGEGTGLGLSMVDGIVKRFGGTVTVLTEPGHGCTFHLDLPPADCGDDAPDVDTPTSMPPRGGAGQRILYVDDDDGMVLIGEAMLRRLGYRVDGHTNASSAQKALAADPLAFDALVSDFNMPGMSGLDLAAQALQLRPDLPVALASGLVTDELLAQAEALGVRELIYKPHSLDDLAAALQRMLTKDRVTAAVWTH
jgi:two-component system, cell cycle sensor histidine kinase and response regulator CckA